MNVDDLETPVPVVDLDLLSANLARMQDYCSLHGLRLRPHIKTHKCLEIARMQLELGAVGITCQKLGEAEVFAGAGIDDVHMSYPLVAGGKSTRLAELARRVRVSVSVDSYLGLLTAALAAASAGVRIPIWVDFDSDAGRTGVTSIEDALRLAQLALASEHLEFGGLITYPLSDASGLFYERASEVFASAGISIPGFSGAGTPTAWSAHLTPGLTEVRQGSYVFFDRSTVGDGAATLDHCALHVHATVVSRPTADRAILDSGSKVLSSDRIPEGVGQGYGLIREYPDAVIERLYEEHALVRVPTGCTGLALGERVRVLPNHVCVVVNLHDELIGARAGIVEKRLFVAARGKSR